MGPDPRLPDWNRRMHSLLGLYLLCCLWLFALTGLLLNHSWSFTEFWAKRKTTTTERSFARPPSGSPLEQAQHLLLQWDLKGEIHWLAIPPDTRRLDFRVLRPGRQIEIRADLAAARATLVQTDVNAWGLLRALHTFTGQRRNDRANERDWIVTSVWAWSMDAIAVGVLALVAGGIVAWLGRPGRFLTGLAALGSGTLACGWLVFGLRWFASP